MLVMLGLHGSLDGNSRFCSTVCGQLPQLGLTILSALWIDARLLVVPLMLLMLGLGGASGDKSCGGDC